ncbi:hypothetical protein PFAS1_15365 [Pseudomonas frederiksbergensis]|nr:hypothetical protein PFAS1_15365 [Pseudomonas frederiksbergensis]
MKKRSLRGSVFFVFQIDRGATFASKPAPTLDFQWTLDVCSPEIKCGSGLAREDDLQDGAILPLCIPVQVQKQTKTGLIYILCTI